MHRELIAAKREPDCWINVYRDDRKPNGQMMGVNAWETLEEADRAFHIADKVGIYRLKVNLKPPQNPS